MMWFALFLVCFWGKVYFNLRYCGFRSQSNFDQKMAYRCFGVLFGMFQLEESILTNFHLKKKTTKTVVTKHALYSIWVVYYVEAVTIEFVLLMECRAWISEEGITEVWKYSFGIFVSFDVVLLVFTFSCFVLPFSNFPLPLSRFC